MQRFEPPPLPESTGGLEPVDPYAPTPAPYPQHAPVQDPYGLQQPPSWGRPGVNHPQGGTVLALGILSVCGLPVLGPFAWFMGARALREVDASPVPVANRGQLLAGQITGIIGTVFLVLGALWAVAVVGLVLTA